eukprot:1161468-Pelagomonas_calceolata.AAC.9
MGGAQLSKEGFYAVEKTGGRCELPVIPGGHMVGGGRCWASGSEREESMGFVLTGGLLFPVNFLYGLPGTLPLSSTTVVPQEGGHGCSTRTARFTCLSGRDMAVPLGRNHVPPEVLLRQGAESGWVSQPDCLETPNTTVLEGMVGSHIKKLHAIASSGLDGAFQGDPVLDVIQTSWCACGGKNVCLPSSECQTLLNILDLANLLTQFQHLSSSEGGHGCSTRTARFTCLSGRGMAVPSARNHAPPEVLLRQGAESGWVPQPDCLETPSTTVLEGMVGSHIKKLNVGASSEPSEIRWYSYTLP